MVVISHDYSYNKYISSRHQSPANPFRFSVFMCGVCGVVWWCGYVVVWCGVVWCGVVWGLMAVERDQGHIGLETELG